MNEPTLNPKSGLLRFRIDISYDGDWLMKSSNHIFPQGMIDASFAPNGRIYL